MAIRHQTSNPFIKKESSSFDKFVYFPQYFFFYSYNTDIEVNKHRSSSILVKNYQFGECSSMLIHFWFTSTRMLQTRNYQLAIFKIIWVKRPSINNAKYFLGRGYFTRFFYRKRYFSFSSKIIKLYSNEMWYENQSKTRYECRKLLQKISKLKYLK